MLETFANLTAAVISLVAEDSGSDGRVIEKNQGLAVGEGGVQVV